MKFTVEMIPTRATVFNPSEVELPADGAPIEVRKATGELIASGTARGVKLGDDESGEPVVNLKVVSYSKLIK